jgi:putative ABC transport system permease protein
MIHAILLMALREIRRNALRSLLTMLGVVIGVGAVIALVSIGQGATQKVTNDIAKLGKNLLILSAGAHRHGGTEVAARPLQLADMQAIQKQVSGIESLAPAAQTSALVVAGNQNWQTTIIGTTDDYLKVRDYEIAKGRSFTRAEESAGVAVCVIGDTVKQQLFPSQDPLGQQIRIKRTPCTVIGTLVPKGQAGMGGDQDDVIIMPLRAVQRRVMGTTDLSTIYISAEDGHDTSVVSDGISVLMRERRHLSKGAPDDFEVHDMTEIAETVSSATGALTALLGAIAAVSLVVGGIGIMNIMLVSVTERTREIGIRLAIGALSREVLLQFLVEAIVLSTLGGVIGMILGLAGSYFASHALGIPFTIAPAIIAIAFLFSAAVGVAFGFLPARKAARLNPIEALRHE